MKNIESLVIQYAYGSDLITLDDESHYVLDTRTVDGITSYIIKPRNLKGPTCNEYLHDPEFSNECEFCTRDAFQPNSIKQIRKASIKIEYVDDTVDNLEADDVNILFERDVVDLLNMKGIEKTLTIVGKRHCTITCYGLKIIK